MWYKLFWGQNAILGKRLQSRKCDIKQLIAENIVIGIIFLSQKCEIKKLTIVMRINRLFQPIN